MALKVLINKEIPFNGVGSLEVDTTNVVLIQGVGILDAQVDADKKEIQVLAKEVREAHTHIHQDKATVATDKDIVKADKAIVDADKKIVNADKITVAIDKATVSADKAIVIANKNASEVAKDEATKQQVIATAKASEASTSASQALSSQNTAKVSEVNAKASEVSATASQNAAKASEDKALVSEKASKVSETNSKTSENKSKASEVNANDSEVNALASKVAAKVSEGSADASEAVATQKANLATTKATEASDSANNANAAQVAAEIAANRAERAMAALSGALIEMGGCDLSGGKYPTPFTDSNGTKRSCFWKVTKGGTVSGVQYGIGDTVVYSVELNDYYKIDNTESVTSVNGKQGVVTLNAAEVGALSVGGKAVDAAKLNGYSDYYSPRNNPTKANVGLSNVPNWAATGAVNDASDSKFATSGGVKKAYDLAGTKITKAQGDSYYLGKTAKASDSDKLDGLNSTDFSRSNHTHTAADVGALTQSQGDARYVQSGGGGAIDKAKAVVAFDTRSTNPLPLAVQGFPGTRFDFKANSADGFSQGGTYHGVMSFRPYGSTDNSSGGGTHQLAFGQNGRVGVRYGNATWGDWGYLYSTTHKPTPADIGAVNRAGDTMTGRLVLTAYDPFEIQRPSSWSYLTIRSGAQEAHIAQNDTTTEGAVANSLHLRPLGVGNGSLMIQPNLQMMHKTAHGYVKIGCSNTSYAHFNTDRAKFHFDKELRVAGEIYVGSSYNQRVYHQGYKPALSDLAGIAAKANLVGNTNLNTTVTAYIAPPSLSWWGDCGIGHSQMVKTGNGYTGNGYVFKIGARDVGKGHAWIGMDNYDSGNLIFGTNQVGSAAPVWSTVYSTRNKPTAADVGALAVGSAAASATRLAINASTSTTYYPLLSTSATGATGSGNCYIPTGANIPKVRYSDGHTQIAHGYLGASGLAFSTEGFVYPRDNANRDAGMYGIYDSNKIGHIWSMGTSYKVNAAGTNFGSLYGFAYKHTNNTTGGTMGGGHMAVWCVNGSPKVSLGDNIWAAGNIGAYSDGRVKTDLEIIPNALEKVGKINGYTYKRTDLDDNEPRHAGVIAQEILEVLPEVVTGGATEEDPDGHYSVAYGNISALLIEAIKELTAKVEKLEGELNAK